MKKKGIRLLAWLLIMSMLLSFIPDLSVKAEDDELPTIEELAEIFDPYATLLIDPAYGFSWVGFANSNDLMTFVDNELGSDYEIIKKENEYIIRGTKIGYAVKLKFSEDELTEVDFWFGIFFPEEFKVDKSLASVPKLTCTNPKHKFRQSGSGCHVYMAPNGKGGSDFRFIYKEWSNWWLKTANERNSIYSKLEPGKIYYVYEEKDENGKHIVEECTYGHEGHIRSRFWGQEFIPATCTEPGIEPYYWCPICSTYFDCDKKEYKFSELPIIIPINPNAHPYDGSVYLFDEESHWLPTTCIHKDIRRFEFPHRYDEDGICEKCGYRLGDNIVSGNGTVSENGTVSGNDSTVGDGSISGNDSTPGDDGSVGNDGIPGDDGSVGNDGMPGDDGNVGNDSIPGDGSVSGNDSSPGDGGNLGNDSVSGNDSTSGDDGKTDNDSKLDNETKPEDVRIVKRTDYDTLDIANILKSNGKFKSFTVSGNNGVLTVNAGTKLLMENANWSVKGYYDGRVTNATEDIKWNAAGDTKADIKALKKYATAKYNKKSNSTKLIAKSNKKVSGSVYAVKLVDDKGNTIILNIERDEINKSVKKTKLTKSVSGNLVTAQDLAKMNDGDSVKTVNLSLVKLGETSKSRLNNNAITWMVGSGKKAVTLKTGQITSVVTKKGTVAYLTVTDDASVKVLSGDTKGTIKLSATVDRKSFKTSIKVK